MNKEFMKTEYWEVTSMTFAKRTIVAAIVVVLSMTAAAPRASAEASLVRWDIATVPCSGPGGSYPCTLNPGGSATAMAVDCAIPGIGCTSITMMGSGTFIAPDQGGSSRAVTGGGKWKVVAADGTTTSGTYVVTELLAWQKSEPLAVPACGTCETTDNIGDIHDAWGGLAMLRVAYSDGTTGLLTLACTGLPDPFSVTEGITASKGVRLDNIAIPGVNVPPLPPTFETQKVLLPVLFWNPGVFQYTVEFHVHPLED
jgi:hypothetical protein